MIIAFFVWVVCVRYVKGPAGFYERCSFAIQYYLIRENYSVELLSERGKDTDYP